MNTFGPCPADLVSLSGLRLAGGSEPGLLLSQCGVDLFRKIDSDEGSHGTSGGRDEGSGLGSIRPSTAPKNRRLTLPEGCGAGQRLSARAVRMALAKRGKGQSGPRTELVATEAVVAVSPEQKTWSSENGCHQSVVPRAQSQPLPF